MISAVQIQIIGARQCATLTPTMDKNDGENTGSNKRRRTSPDIFHINDLPNTLLADVAAFLPDPSRALFALAMTAPTSSWRHSRWKRPPSVASAAILSSTTKWESLDFGNIENILAGKLTDDDVCGILSCINAKLKTLKLTGCVNITGSGLEPLRGSLVLQQIDLSLVGQHKCPVIEPDPSISEAAVLPILDSIIDTRDNSLKHIQLPVKWSDKRSTELGQILEKFHRLMENRRLCCSTCDAIIDNVYEDGKWYGDDEDEWYGLQRFTCCNCMKHFCYEHGGEDEHLRFCSNCEREYCTQCVPKLVICDKCGNGICNECGELKECEGCQARLCVYCIHKCEFCDGTRCQDCKPLRQCNGEDCTKEHCEECFDGNDHDVVKCDDCEKVSCTNCQYLNCSKDWKNACSGCERSISRILTPKLKEENEELRKEIEKLRQENQDLRR